MSSQALYVLELLNVSKCTFSDVILVQARTLRCTEHNKGVLNMFALAS